MRCLTLANVLREQGANITFICREHRGNLFEQIELSNHKLLRISHNTVSSDGKLTHAHWLGATQEEDVRQSAEALITIGCVDWLIVDHYALDIEWETAMRPHAKHIMVIDDLADRVHDCDLLLDQNMHQNIQERYDILVPPSCTKLLGPKYALLRPEFKEARSNLKVRDGNVRRIFVFFGGSDPTNETGKALKAIQQTKRPDIAIDVIVGAANPHQEEIANLCSTLPKAKLHRQINNIAELMMEADLAIGAGGGTVWERCCLGLPTIVLSISSNQNPSCKAIASIGAILYLGEGNKIDADLIESALKISLSATYLMESLGGLGLAVVDGRGVDRVLRELLSNQLQLRLVSENDFERVFHWRNHIKTRKFSFHSDPISLEEHHNWFFEKLMSTQCILLIGFIENDPIGVLRYDIEESTAAVSVYLNPDKHGFGYGAMLLRKGEDWVRLHHPNIKELTAEVLTENFASMNVFNETGYKKFMVTLKKILK